MVLIMRHYNVVKLSKIQHYAKRRVSTTRSKFKIYSLEVLIIDSFQSVYSTLPIFTTSLIDRDRKSVIMLPINLKYLRHKNKLSQKELAVAMKLPRTTLGDYERGKTEPSLAMLVMLADYFDVTIDQLVRTNLSHRDLEILKNNDLRILAISVDKDNQGNIELVDTKAEAGYLDSYQDPEYIRDLPKILFPNIPQGTFRGFEIKGDSMLPVEPGSIIISQYVERLADVKNDRTYIIVSKSDGLVYKRVRIDIEKQKITLISDHDVYLPYSISFDEIAEVWQYYAHLSFSDSKVTFNYMMEEKINDIQRKVSGIHEKLNV